ncbi:MAG: DEAD/DEAH box helicase family protein [Nitrososphaerota archaeon]|nr:DEAD/DEAH box helicase family protein [Nitrososphaerota archaeon]
MQQGSARVMNESETRKQLIDKQLKRAGWLWTYVKEEVNSLKSDFASKSYVLSQGKGDDSGRFIDYLLLAEDNSPAAFIEAKKFSRSEDNGRAQARTYLSDIRKQIGENVPYFLTNGHSWLFIDQDGIERKVSGPFSQSDLARRNELFRKRTDPTKVNLGRIVDRPRSILIVKQMMEHIESGHRAALISMATGTGKTRVAMAIIDALIKSNVVRNVLFVADRIALANQAKSAGFKQFFSEPVIDLRENPKSFPNGLYVTTVQTLRSGRKGKYYEKFSPGFFDLVIFDEAHRSIYDPNREIHRYFDAMRIGLTATPSNAENRNTFELFDCDGEKATVEYTYNEAIDDGILVPYRAESIDTQVLSLGIEGAKLSKDLQTQLIKQEEDPRFTMLPGSSFAKVFMDDKTNELVVREFLKRCYKSDEGKPAKTIVFCANVAHAKHLKRIFNKLDPSLGKDVQIIVSEIYRYTDEIARFKLDSEPRVALSVGVLDTGVDIPEVCNLVFVKPVFSGIRFWQMIGRGTRNLEACQHKEWLPNREKLDFQILDFNIGQHSNLKYHNLEQSKERKAGTDVLTRIFLNRVNLLKKSMDSDQRMLVEDKIVHEIEALNTDSFIVREKLPIIKKVVSRKFDLKSYIEELKRDIAPLISLNPGSDPQISAFILQVEKLFGYIVDGRNEKILEIKDYVVEKMENVLQKDSLEAVQSKRVEIMKALQDTFWDGIAFSDVEFLIRELAPLMVYYEPNPRKMLQVDAPDLILNVEQLRHIVKEDPRMKEFVESNPLLLKIKNGEGVTSAELLTLEGQLKKIRPEVSIDNVQNLQKVDFVVFLRKIMGLSHDYDPQELIEKEFDRLIIDNNHHYNSDQLRFLELLKKVFARTKRLKLEDFTVPPLSNERPLDKFLSSELEGIVVACGKIRMK